MTRLAVAASSILVFGVCAAQNVPALRVFQSVQARQGEWRVDLLEAPGLARDATRPSRSVCADDPLTAITYEERPNTCKHRVAKDMADQAVRETVCAHYTSTSRLTREGKSVLAQITVLGPDGKDVTKWRFTALGPCRGGKGA